MSITLSNSVFSRTIANSRLQKVLTAESREAATAMGLIDKFKDLFFSNKKEKFLSDLYDFIHNVNQSTDETEFSSIRQILRDVPLKAAGDFFSGKDASGNPILHAALVEGHSSQICAYGKFLTLLPGDKRDALLSNLVAARDQHETLGIGEAFRLGHVDAIRAFKPLILLLPRDQRNEILEELFLKSISGIGHRLNRVHTGDGVDNVFVYKLLLDMVPDEERNDFLTKVLHANGRTRYSCLQRALMNEDVDALVAYRYLLKLLPAAQRDKWLPTFLLASDDRGMPGLGLMFGGSRSAAAVAGYQALVELLPESQRGTFLGEVVTRLAARKEPSLSDALDRGDIATIIEYKKLFKIVPVDQRKWVLGELLPATGRDGSSGLALALGNGRGGAISAYRSLLELLPATECGELLTKLIMAPDRYGNPGLAWALQQGHSDAIAAYASLLELLPERERATWLADILVAKDVRGIPGLVWAAAGHHPGALTNYEAILESVPADHPKRDKINILLSITGSIKNQTLGAALRTGDPDTIAAYARLFELMPAQCRGDFFGNFMTEKGRADRYAPTLTLNIGNARLIHAYTALLKTLPATLRNELLASVFVANERNGYHALVGANAATINACKALLELLPEAQRNRYLTGMLKVKTNDGTTGLGYALIYGDVAAIRSYKGLLQMLPASQRAASIRLLGAAGTHGSSPLAKAIAGGHAGAIAAYKEVLQLLSYAERCDHLETLLVAASHFGVPAIYDGLLGGSAESIAAYEDLLNLIPAIHYERILRKILLPQLDQWAFARNANTFFNHLNNQSHCSLLTIINNLNISDPTLKERLMGEMSKRMIDVDVSRHSLVQSILDVWINDPAYLRNPDVLKTFDTIIFDRIVRSANTGKLTLSKQVVPVVLKLVQDITSKETGGKHSDKRGTFMLENNGFFIQLMAMCTNHSSPVIKKMAEDLYDRYLNLDELVQHKVRLSELGYEHGIKGSGDAGQLEPLASDDRAYLLVRYNAAGKSYDGLIMSKDKITEMLDTEKISDLSNVAYVTKMVTPAGLEKIEFVTQGQFNSAEVYPQFSLFKESFQVRSQRTALNNLLTLLNLGNTNTTQEADVLTYDYTEDFVKALASRTSQKKLTSLEDQRTLLKIFGRFLTTPDNQSWTMDSLPSLTDAHIGEVLQTLRPVVGQTGSNTLGDARILFSLAAMVATLSSSSYFGEHDASPFAIRVYAAGLLEKAHQLNQHVCNQEAYQRFMKTLLGLDMRVYATCTGVLSGLMREYAAGNKDFNNIMMRLKPIAWV